MGQLTAVDDILKAIESGDIDAGLSYFATLAPEKQRRFLEEIGSLQSETAARLLTALYPTAEQKDLKKLIKKLIFHLKTRGIQVEEPAAAGESVLKKVEITKEQIALGSNYDHENIRVILLAFELRKKQFVITHITQRFGEGLIDIMSAPIEKQSLNSMVEDYRSRTKSPMVLVEISPAYAMYLIEEASRQSGRQTDEIKGLKQLATGLTGDIRVPSDIRHLQIPASVPEVPWQQAAAEDIFEPFSLTWKGIEEDQKEYGSIIHPQIVLPPHIVEEKRMAYLKELAATERIKAIQPHLSRMFEDYAYFFYRQGEYANCAALLTALNKPDIREAITLFFLGRSFKQKEEEQEQQEQQTPGLIVNPYDQKL